MGQKRKRCRNTYKQGMCVFCGKDENDEVLFGKFHSKNNMVVHEFCMFFSSGLIQRGSRETDGILRFLLSDIKEEVSRGQKLKCCYCKEVGATVGCVISNCRRSYHYPCGIKHRVLNQHINNFASYCHSHKPKQKAIDIADEIYCNICCASLSTEEHEDCIYSPCCKNWFHHLCMQKYALSAGMHFFKCPMCNNVSEFIEEMKQFGICVPDKDAAWELDNNAYNELLVRPDCGADNCECPKGKDYDGNGIWNLLSCIDCGAHARHVKCGGLDVSIINWKCSDCVHFEEKLKQTCATESINAESIDVKDVSINIDSMNSLVTHNESLFCASTSGEQKLDQPCSSIENIDVSVDDDASDTFVAQFKSSCSTETCNDSENINDSINILCNNVLESGKEMCSIDSVHKTNNIMPVEKVSTSQSVEEDLLSETVKTLSIPNNYLKEHNSNVEKSPKSLLFVLNSKKVQTMKKVSTKRKLAKKIKLECCSGKNQCIRKMFGLPCLSS